MPGFWFRLLSSLGIFSQHQSHPSERCWNAARESSLQETWARSHTPLMIQHLLQVPEILTFMFNGWQLSILPESSLGASHGGMTTGRGFSQHLHKLCQQDSADHNVGVHVMVTPMYSATWGIWWAMLRGRGVLGLVNSRKGLCCGLKALLATSYTLIALHSARDVFNERAHFLVNHFWKVYRQ